MESDRFLNNNNNHTDLYRLKGQTLQVIVCLNAFTFHAHI